MKHFSFVVCLLTLLIVLPQCKKDCKLRPVSRENDQMLSYAAANNLTVTQHPSGIYYQIVEPGTGAAVNANSLISITYKGTFLNGDVFDEQTSPNNTQANPAWSLGSLIEGWRIGIPLIKSGGRIKLIVPSSLGYGCEDYYTIPGNSVLFFDVTLVQVQ